jgi:hypothetical protein
VFLSTADTANDELSQIVEQMLYPVLYNIKLDLPGTDASDVYPSTLPNLHYGSQLGLFGRYAKDGTGRALFSATLDGKPLQDAFQVTLPVPQVNNRAIPQLWAANKVDALLDEIKLKGELPELKKAVIYLGLRYRIVTPYTSLLVLEAQQQGSTPIIDKTRAAMVTKAEVRAERLSSSRLFRIRYAVPTTPGLKPVTLKVYTLRGELVRTIVNHVTPGGRFIAHWDGCNQSGIHLGAGTYLLVLEIGRECMAAPLRITQ